MPPVTAKLKADSYPSTFDEERHIEDFNRNSNNTDKAKPTLKERFRIFLTYARPLLVMLFFDVGLPLAVYYILKIWLSVLIALILSGIPPLLRVFYVFWKKRHIDVLGCIFVFSFVLSAVLSIISGNVRLTLLRDSTVTAVISLMFFVTLFPIKTKWFIVRPLVFLFSQQMMSEQPPIEWVDKEGNYHSMEKMEWLWQHISVYRRYCYILDAIWATVLLGEFLAKVIMVESSLDIDHIILYGNIILICIMVVMTNGTLIASHFVRKRCVIHSEVWRKENDFTDRLPQ
ncbi:hypothetical protein BD408DRAFT_450629 [Parasitella parasitica]|nr:hypothetical protein BD408DRAFT_450629 [Parasitella parasitica]